MEARLDLRFGSFNELIGTAVHRAPWWFRTALGVVLAGSVLWEDLGECVLTGPSEPADLSRLDTDWFRTAPQTVNTEWFRLHAPIALSLASEPALCSVDLIATRVEEHVSVAYPFLLRETDKRVLCGFSSQSDTHVRNSIVNALAGRFLWAARPA